MLPHTIYIQIFPVRDERHKIVCGRIKKRLVWHLHKKWLYGSFSHQSSLDGGKEFFLIFFKTHLECNLCFGVKVAIKNRLVNKSTARIRVYIPTHRIFHRASSKESVEICARIQSAVGR